MYRILSETKQELDGTVYYKCGEYYWHKGKLLHRAVWESVNGSIPDGYHIHHLNGDKSDNRIDNLTLYDGRQHMEYHGKLLLLSGKISGHIELAQEAARAWHSGDDGRLWHSAQSKANWDKRGYRTLECSVCGKSFDTRDLRDTPRFCSGKCKAAARRKSGADNVKRSCPICGNEFSVNKYSKQSTCGYECARRKKWGLKSKA
jgi:endogenous inhibitor of DNA gyrase (YacG/DUF329 family)